MTMSVMGSTIMRRRVDRCWLGIFSSPVDLVADGQRNLCVDLTDGLFWTVEPSLGRARCT